MANGFESIFEWPTPELRDIGLFTQTVPQLPWNDRFPLGVQYQPMDFTDVRTVAVGSDPCSTDADLLAAREFPAVVTQTGFLIYDQITCSTLWKTEEELQENLDDRWPLMVSEAFAREFLTGAAGSDHNLTTDTVAPVATSTVREGIAELEEKMAIGLGNTLGMIHMTPSALVYGVTNGTIDEEDEGLYVSPGGHHVVADAGYQVAETSTTVMYGTGLVRWSVSGYNSRSTTFSDYIDQVTRKNIGLWVKQAYGIIIFDPATVWSVTATRA